ncbi:MAG: nucleotide sugar dehydrogenase [Nitrososphaeraceae archaeon]
MISVKQIRDRNFCLCIVGMGRIGLPMAVSFASKGVRVIGVEKNEKIIQMLKDGKALFFEEGLSEALASSTGSGKLTFVSDADCDYTGCQIIIVAIGTPLKENLMPNMSLIQDVVSEISRKASADSVVILRSTLVPGTTTNKILPQINKSSSRLRVAVCPERIVEGQALVEIARLPEIIGVEDEYTGSIVRELFLLLGQKQISITNTKTAEAAKLFTNVYRYVNFALSNEFALICENLNIDARETIHLANLGYSRSNIPLPGPAAGPCLRKDGLFLSNVSSINLIKVAWLLNESIPLHIVETIENKLGNLHGRKVGVLGKAYKKNIDDVRDSPAVRLIEELESRGAEVLSFDPHIPSPNTMDEVLESEILILAVNHSYFDQLDANKLRQTKLVYDVWGQLSGLNVSAKGTKYISLGGGIWSPQESIMAKF